MSIMSRWILLVFVVVVIPDSVYGQTYHTYNTYATNYYEYLKLYNKSEAIDFIPKLDLTQPIDIKMSMVLHALFDFDEERGSIEMSASLKLNWDDELVDINYGVGLLMFGGSVYSTVYILNADGKFNFISVRYDKMWTPRLVVDNSVNEFSRIGDPAYMCRYNLMNGHVSWQPKFLLKSACSPDVTYYPFDKQDCTSRILSPGYKYSEVNLISVIDKWDLSSYEGNGEWEIVETHARSYKTKSQSVFEIKISLKRNPLYFAFNIIIPVIAVSLLNGVVFWLPVDSGERVGFSITCFLTFMVLLSTILGYLPASSGTMSYLCYYVVVMMIFSGLVTAFVVINLYLYHKQDQESVPWCLKAFIRFWRFNWLLKLYKFFNKSDDSDTESTGSQTPIIEVVKERKDSTTSKPKIKIILSRPMVKNAENKIERHPATEAWRENDDINNDEKVTWKEFSAFLDTFLFLAFLSTEAFFSITFLVPLAYRH